MSPQTIFFDLDDTLYPSTTGLWDLIGQRIDLFMHEFIGLDWAIIPEKRHSLFNQYGTTLRGLVAEYKIDPDHYLDFVHDVPIEELLDPAPELRMKIRSLQQQKVIFTNADRNHANRVIDALSLQGCFQQIIDIRELEPFCKPQREAFERAFLLAGNLSAEDVIMIDDTPRNLETAVQMGCLTIQVGKHPTVEGVHAHIEDINMLDNILT